MDRPAAIEPALEAISTERSLADAYARVGEQRGILPTLIDAALLELQLSSDVSDKAGIKERVATRLARIEVAAGRDMNGAPACSPPSARPRRSSDCSARCGAS